METQETGARDKSVKRPKPGPASDQASLTDEARPFAECPYCGCVDRQAIKIPLATGGHIVVDPCDRCKT